MQKKNTNSPTGKVVDVSDEEYQRLAAEASAKLRVEARKQFPRRDRSRSSTEVDLVSDEEYARLAESAREGLRSGSRPTSKRRPIASDTDMADVSPEEYRRLADAMVSRSEERGRHQEQTMSLVKRVLNPITIAVLVFGGICVYYLMKHRSISGF